MFQRQTLEKVKVKNEVQSVLSNRRSENAMSLSQAGGEDVVQASTSSTFSTPKQGSSRKNVDLGVPIWERLSHDNRDVIRREELKRQRQRKHVKKVSLTSSRSSKTKTNMGRLNEQRKTQQH